VIDRVARGGGNFTAPHPTALTGVSAPHGSCPGPVLVRAYEKEMSRLGVDYRLNNRGKKLIQDTATGEITGIEVETGGYTYTIKVKDAVILATGGFSLNQDMKNQYFSGTGWNSANDYFKTSGTTNSSGNTGDGHLMAQAVGANLINMNNFSTNFTTIYADGTYLSLTALRMQAGVMINSQGKRFANEVSVNITTWQDQNSDIYFLLDHNNLATLGNLQQYYSEGYLKKADTWKSLAELIGVNGDGLETTIREITASVNGNTTLTIPGTNFDKYWKNPKPPYYAAKITPALHSTYGGIEININAQALDSNGNVIPGLYAAGCVSSNNSYTALAATVNWPCAFGYAAAHHILENTPYVKEW
ncbi:MAG: FAD-binding protein, partial [Treponema sp.]|nr:FAD-binding protein [Treponema sp.]